MKLHPSAKNVTKAGNLKGFTWKRSDTEATTTRKPVDDKDRHWDDSSFINAKNVT